MRLRRSAYIVVVTIVALFVGSCAPAARGPVVSAPTGEETAETSPLVGPLTCVELSLDEVLNYQVPRAERRYRIALLQVSLQGYYYVAIAYGAFHAADEAGVDLEMVAASGYASPEQQLQQMEDILQGDFDAIVMAPSDIYGSVPAVEKAIERKLPVVNISTQVASPDVVQVIPDDYVKGQAAANRMAELFGSESAQGIIIAGPSRATWSRNRTQGFQDRAKEAFANIEAVAIRNQLVDPAEGLKSFEDAIQANPDIKWVYSVASEILPAQALPPQYRGEIRYVAHGLNPESLIALESGWIDTLYGEVPVSMGYIGVAKAVEILNGEEQPRLFCLPAPLFTADNFDEMPTEGDMFPEDWEPPD